MFKVMNERCNECLFGENKIVSNERRTEILQEIRRKDSYFNCHKTKGVACRGDWDQFGCGQLGRIAGRLGAVEFVTLPAYADTGMTTQGHTAGLTELAGRVEKLTGPCRETDLAIHLALYPDGKIAQLVASHRRGFDGKIGTAWEIFHTGAVVYETRNEEGRCYSNGGHPLLAMTGSLDAAMTLVPPNHRWLMNGPDVDGAGDDIKPCAAVMPYGVSLFLPGDTHQAATPVLAFLSAVLRARAALESSHG